MKKTVFLFLSLSFFLMTSAQDETKDWFAFQQKTDYSNSRINMKSWLDAPAGKHGFLKMKDDDLVFEDGTRVKFWGVNIASDKPFVEPQKLHIYFFYCQIQ